MADNSLQVQEKKEVQSSGEPTRNKPVFVPAVDIFETEGSLTLVADMPGVALESVSIDLDKDQLTIRGTVDSYTNEHTPLLSEYAVGDYYRQFNVSNAIDRAKIEATMKDGVLKVTLPKAEAAKPRKIEIKAA
ncbi:MAG: Hsp20/alpha crystallin family protein [Syntrophobacteraceae bacterium]